MGDALTDFELTSLSAYHQSHRKPLTVLKADAETAMYLLHGGTAAKQWLTSLLSSGEVGSKWAEPGFSADGVRMDKPCGKGFINDLFSCDKSIPIPSDAPKSGLYSRIIFEPQNDYLGAAALEESKKRKNPVNLRKKLLKDWENMGWGENRERDGRNTAFVALGAENPKYGLIEVRSADNDHAPTGYLRFNRSGENFLAIDHIGSDPNFKGSGTSTVNKLKEYAISQGRGVAVNGAGESAKGFYEKVGFQKGIAHDFEIPYENLVKEMRETPSVKRADGMGDAPNFRDSGQRACGNCVHFEAKGRNNAGWEACGLYGFRTSRRSLCDSYKAMYASLAPEPQASPQMELLRLENENLKMRLALSERDDDDSPVITGDIEEQNENVERTDDDTPIKRTIFWKGFEIGLQYQPFDLRHDKLLPCGYGEIVGTNGQDGMALDCYVGSDLESDLVFVVDQLNAETGEFDEHKLFIGFDDDAATIKDLFVSLMGQERFGGIRETVPAKVWDLHEDSEHFDDAQPKVDAEDVLDDFDTNIDADEIVLDWGENAGVFAEVLNAE
jgi:GNAT superfamily N-acetyltransferase